MAVQASYALYVDWNNDGDFADAGEDLSGDWIHARIRRGFSGPLARVPMSGRASFQLQNASKVYSPPTTATVLPMRPVLFQMTYGGTTTTLFRGYIEEIRPDVGVRGRRQCTLECVDAIAALLDQYAGDIALQTDVFADDIISAVVAAVYTPASTNYQQGYNLFPTSGDRWAWDKRASSPAPLGPYETVRAMDKILDTCTADWGRFFISAAGVPTFYNRHKMVLDATTEFTISDLMTDMRYRKTAETLYNYVEITIAPRAVGEVLEVLGELAQDDAPRIEASATGTFILQFRDPSNISRWIGGLSCTTPVATTDYHCTDEPEGEGTSMDASVTAAATVYGDKAEITLTNASAAPVFVQKLQIRGYAVRMQDPVTVVAQDATSIAAYGKRKLALTVPLMSWAEHAQSLAAYLLAIHKDPVHEIQGVTFVANRNATHIAAARDLELMDKVVLTETQTGLSAVASHIYAIEHNIDSKWLHEVTLDLEIPYVPGTPFILGDALNSGHVLIY